jgi:hypothetical protein
MLYLSGMEKGYIYLGRLVDHNGNFVTNYHKIGKSCDFKVRETNLNSTHMPIDVQFIRVFETDYMSNLEKVLHACFSEYRVIKEYDWRRNITTEWFDVQDDELLYSKLTSVVKNFPNTVEIDMECKVQSDTGTTVTEKVEMMKVIKSVKNRWRLKVYINGEDITCETGADTFASAVEYICDKVGYERVDQDEFILSDRKEEFKERYSAYEEYAVRKIGNLFLYTAMSNHRKAEFISNMVKRYDIPEITYEIVSV